MEISRPHPAVVRVKAEIDDLPNHELSILIRADAHCDSPSNRWDREQAHLEMIQARNGLIVDLGDLFDAMQGRFDPRADPSSIMPELAGADYADRLVEFAYRRYHKYARNWLCMLMGNHETKFEKHYGSNLTNRLVDRMNGVGGRVQAMEYAGYLILSLSFKGQRTRFVIRLMHGSGGNAPATAGAAKDIYRASTYVDADVIVSGHIHQDRTRKTMVERINSAFKPYWSKQVHIVCGGYKDDSTLNKGWSVEKEMKPGAIGAYLLTFTGYRPGGKKSVNDAFSFTYQELE